MQLWARSSMLRERFAQSLSDFAFYGPQASHSFFNLVLFAINLANKESGSLVAIGVKAESQVNLLQKSKLPLEGYSLLTLHRGVIDQYCMYAGNNRSPLGEEFYKWEDVERNRAYYRGFCKSYWTDACRGRRVLGCTGLRTRPACSRLHQRWVRGS